MNRSVEIICVGNELLNGYTLNTNAHWMANEIANVGGIVRRVTEARDRKTVKRNLKQTVHQMKFYVRKAGGSVKQI